MKTNYHFLFVELLIIGLLMSCSAANTVEPEVVKTEVEPEPAPEFPMEEFPTFETESECVFNNDYEGLSMDWVNRLGLEENARWDNKRRAVILPQGTDSLLITQGGCVHMNYSIRKRFYTDTNAVSNQNIWRRRGIELAKLFDFSEFALGLTEEVDKWKEKGLGEIEIMVPDLDSTDNQFISGYLVKRYRDFTEIRMSKYLN